MRRLPGAVELEQKSINAFDAFVRGDSVGDLGIIIAVIIIGNSGDGGRRWRGKLKHRLRADGRARRVHAHEVVAAAAEITIVVKLVKAEAIRVGCFGGRRRAGGDG